MADPPVLLEAAAEQAPAETAVVELPSRRALKPFDIWELLNSYPGTKDMMDSFMSNVRRFSKGPSSWKKFQSLYGLVYNPTLITNLVVNKLGERNNFYVLFVGLTLSHLLSTKKFVVLHVNVNGTMFCREIVNNKPFIALDDEILNPPTTNCIEILVGDRPHYAFYKPRANIGHVQLGTPPHDLANPTGFQQFKRPQRRQKKAKREATAEESSDGSSVEEDGQAQAARKCRKRKDDATPSVQPAAGAAGCAPKPAHADSAVDAASTGAVHGSATAPPPEKPPDEPDQPLPQDFHAMLLMFNRKTIVEAIAQRADAYLCVIDLQKELNNNGKTDEFIKLMVSKEQEPEAAGAVAEVRAPIPVPLPTRANRTKGKKIIMVGENLFEYNETGEQRHERHQQALLQYNKDMEAKFRAREEKRAKELAEFEKEKKRLQAEKEKKDKELAERAAKGEIVQFEMTEDEIARAKELKEFIIQNRKKCRHQASSDKAAKAAREALEGGRFGLPKTTYDVRLIDPHRILVLCKLQFGAASSWLKTHQIQQKENSLYHVFFAANHMVDYRVRTRYEFHEHSLPKREQSSIDNHKIFGFPDFVVTETESEDDARKMQSFCMRPTSECIREWDEWSRSNVKDKNGVSVHEIVEKALTDDYQKRCEKQKAEDPEYEPKALAQRVVLIPMCFMPVCNNCSPCHKVDRTCGSAKLDNVFQQPLELYFHYGTSDVLGMILPTSMADLCNFPPLCDLPIQA